MHEQLCPFERVILSTEFSCTESHKYFYAEKEGISCKSQPARLNCKLLIEFIKHNSKFALRQPIPTGGELTHGQEMRIKCGGLQGLQEVIGKNTDIHGLLSAAIEQFENLDSLPWDRIMPSVQAYRLRKSGISR